ncbi:MAG: hypothetical protein WBE50_19050, partial [Methyloceanibacter sp.]
MSARGGPSYVVAYPSRAKPRRSVEARDSKPIADVFDLTLVLADVGEKAVAQVKQGAVELMTPRLDQSTAETIAEKL